MTPLLPNPNAFLDRVGFLPVVGDSGRFPRESGDFAMGGLDGATTSSRDELALDLLLLVLPRSPNTAIGGRKKDRVRLGQMRSTPAFVATEAAIDPVQPLFSAIKRHTSTPSRCVPHPRTMPLSSRRSN